MRYNKGSYVMRGLVVKMKIMQVKEISSKLKVKCFGIPHYAQPNRYKQAEKTKKYEINNWR